MIPHDYTSNHPKDSSCSHCGGEARKTLCDDVPGLHTYVQACMACHREYGAEWEEYHHGLTVPSRANLKNATVSSCCR